jgi:hypothetical protein
VLGGAVDDINGEKLPHSRRPPPQPRHHSTKTIGNDWVPSYGGMWRFLPSHRSQLAPLVSIRNPTGGSVTECLRPPQGRCFGILNFPKVGSPGVRQNTEPLPILSRKSFFFL